MDMKVTYELPPSAGRSRLISLVAVAIIAVAALAVLSHNHVAVASILATAAGVLGVNTIAYETPVTGATPPTAIQSRTHQQISAIVTGDGAATTFTITHNWGLTTAQLNGGTWPEVIFEQLLAAGYTAAPLITSKTANAVAFSCTAFTGAGLRVRLKRPYSPTQ